MNFIISTINNSWELLLEASVYVIFGLLVSGLLRMFLNPNLVARHLGRGRFKSVLKASFLGIPVPLCSCGVLPAAISLKKQGANNGATTAFMISTPESGVDSIAVTYALLDPVMTLARPAAAFATATVAGVAENLFPQDKLEKPAEPDLTCTVDGCCDGKDCPPEEHRHHHTLGERLMAGLRYAHREVWNDMAPWFMIGLLLAGLITTLVPEEVMVRYLGGGAGSMLLMLAVGIPLYICATASTPIAAALIMKGVSPGAALVFLLAGPATNITSLTVLFGVLGKRAAAIYLASIAVMAVLFGLIVDQVYAMLGLSAMATIGQAGEIMPAWLEWIAALTLLVFSIKPVLAWIKARLGRIGKKHDHSSHDHLMPESELRPMEESNPGCASPT